MKRLFELLLLSLVLVLAFSCATSSITLSPVDYAPSRAENTETLSAIQKDDLYLGISSGALDGDQGLFFATVGNEGQKTFTFQEGDLEIFLGDRLKNQWKSLGPWSGQQCLLRAADSARRMHFLVGIAGLLDVVAFSFDTYLSMDSSGSWHQETYFDPFGTFFAYNMAMQDQMALAAANKMNLDYLKENLLFSRTLAPGESYSGLILTKAGNRYPDYKFVYKGDESTAMVFERSDAEDLRHPWGEKKFHSTWSMLYTYGVNAPSSFLFTGNSPKIANFYTGFSWRLPEKMDEKVSWNGITKDGTTYTGKDFVENGETTYGTRFGFPVGITLKGSAHGWLLLGADFGFYESVYRQGTFQKGSATYGPVWYEKTPKAKFDMDFQAGLNFVFNFLDVNAMFHYSPFTDAFGYSVGGGFAF